MRTLGRSQRVLLDSLQVVADRGHAQSFDESEADDDAGGGRQSASWECWRCSWGWWLLVGVRGLGGAAREAVEGPGRGRGGRAGRDVIFQADRATVEAVAARHGRRWSSG